MKLLIWGIVAMVGFVASSHAQQATPRPAEQPPERRDSDENEFVISPMRVQDMRGITYLFTSTQTTLAEKGKPIRTTMEALDRAIRAGQVPLDGPALFIFHGVTQDPTNRFIARRWSTAVRLCPSGAYQQAFTDVVADGMQPTGEIPEYSLLWEGMESVNNVTLIQIGVN